MSAGKLFGYFTTGTRRYVGRKRDIVLYLVTLYCTRENIRFRYNKLQNIFNSKLKVLVNEELEHGFFEESVRNSYPRLDGSIFNFACTSKKVTSNFEQ